MLANFVLSLYVYTVLKLVQRWRHQIQPFSILHICCFISTPVQQFVIFALYNPDALRSGRPVQYVQEVVTHFI